MNRYRKIISLLLVLFLITGVYILGSLLASGGLGVLFNNRTKTVLVMGMDNAGVRSDVMMVGFINGREGRVDILSIPRDTQVKIGGRYYKINSAYAIGKEEESIAVVENLLGIEIDGYVKFSFETFRQTIDAIGGVNFDVPQDMFYEDPYQDLYIDLKAGPQHLNGEEAEGLVRFRRYPTGDEGRIAVQQEFIKEIVRQKANPLMLFRLPTVVATLSKNIDTSLDAGTFVELGVAAIKAGTKGLNTIKLPGGPSYQWGVSYYIHSPSQTAALIEEIYNR